MLRNLSFILRPLKRLVPKSPKPLSNYGMPNAMAAFQKAVPAIVKGYLSEDHFSKVSPLKQALTQVSHAIQTGEEGNAAKRLALFCNVLLRRALKR
jgi:hypothetical protein